MTLNSLEATDEIDIVNAKPSRRIIVDPLVPLGRYRYETLDVRGRRTGGGSVLLARQPVAFDVPPSGMVRLVRGGEGG